MQEEIWKDIKDLQGLYQISNKGKIRSYFNDFRILTPQVSKNGYLRIIVKNKHYSIHRLVAETFIPNPQNKPEVNHKDGNKENNCVNNLEWVTRSENQIHSYRILKNIPSMKNHFKNNHVASKTIYQFDKHNNLIKKWDSIIEATNTLNICACNITDCAKGNRKTAGGYIWRYANL